MATISPAERPGNYATVAAGAGECLDDLDQATLIAAYKRDGALLLRGFGADLAAFARLARRLCSTAVVNESPGRETLDAANHIYSVDVGNDAFPLHPELSREPWKPDAALFACLAAPGVGGETTVCDGVELVRALPAEVRDGFAANCLIYGMATWPALLEFWLGTSTPSDAQLAAPPPDCPYQFARLADGQIVRHFDRPALHKPMFCAEPAFGNFLLFARYHNGRLDFPRLGDMQPVPAAWVEAARDAGDRLTRVVAWRQGDVLLLDNTRWMHGRQAISRPDSRRIATFFGYLHFAIPDPHEPPGAIWRRGDFVPPQPPL